MALEVDTITLPSFWASALINDDPSGMTDEEIAAMDGYLADTLEKDGWFVVSDVEGSERFTNSYYLYSPYDYRGGDVMDYVIHRHVEGK